MPAIPTPRMRSFSARRLSAGEIGLARVAFGSEVDYGRVWITQAPPVFPGAVVPLGNEIVFGSWRAARDFSAAGIDEQGWLIHELAHVWQAQRGAVLALAKLGCLRARDYRVPANRPFEALNIEAQAEVARYAWRARMGWPLQWPDAAAIAALWPAPMIRASPG